MKKNFVRLFALLICFVMVVAMVPANANAVALQGKKMPQLKTITAGEYGEGWISYYITETADLIEIAAIAANNPDNYYDAIFDGNGTFTITQNITTPVNMSFNCWSDLVIAPNVTVTLNGGIYGSSLTVNGVLNCEANSFLNPGNALANYGTINLNGGLGLSSYTAVTGNPINYLYDGYVTMSCFFENSAQLQEIADIAASNPSWSYYAILDDQTVYLSTPVELPANVNLQFHYPDFQISGATITVNGNFNIDGNSNCVIKNNIVLNGGSYFYSYENEYGEPASITFEGAVTNNGYMDIYGKLNFKNAVVNNGYMDIWYEYDGSTSFAQPNLYSDSNGLGIVWVNFSGNYFPNDAIAGLNVNDFQRIEKWDDMYIPYWELTEYANSGTVLPPVHEHSVVVDAAVAPTCLTYGKTEGSHCATCGEVIFKQEDLAPLGHDYGLDANGNIDFYDTTCDVCGAERVVDSNRLTHSMYRMYNPNTGEHFYTGSKEERQVLEAAGWKFEGVGFTFPANTGAPVYRLFEPVSGEHLYTMSETEVETLVANGWNMEGIAFNSATSSEVPQYRLWNPNVSVGAYHFTASAEERDVLLAAGWQDQGIGFYTCWQ